MNSQKRGYDHIKAQKEGKKRDLNVCQICGSPDRVEGHHLFDYAYSGASDPNNIITLCHSCHVAVHKGLIDLFIF